MAGLGLAGFFLWLTLRGVDRTSVLQLVAQGFSVAWLALALGFLALGYSCRILRWRRMLQPLNPDLGMMHCGIPLLASMAVNNLLPLRAGDMLRCFGFSNWLQVPSGAVLATVLVERALDMVVVILALGLALRFFSLGGGALGMVQYSGILLFALAAISLLLLLRPALLAPVLARLTRLAGILGPDRQARVENHCQPLLDTLIRLSNRGAMPCLMGYSVLAWLFEGASYWAIARSLSTLPLPEAAWLAMPVGTLATLLPSSPGHVGTFDYFAQLATVAVGNPLAEATAYVLVVHVALWLPTTLIGAICLLIWVWRGAAAGNNQR
ncbi:lysylphosphatidylglycerol synthase transmembrane domain-containing protein [Parahaliea mediterranea]|uniref:lysylphosphatidylglycerol synthase transmembrane domain-containing protein n=1 Tax=Parahaliea mediterranea TaxID=651086 RepID=UPI001300B106|nr:lysylphosphatidylglycerol synthase transmembrane domain-containing protein [Parahaliea mediterranea]